MSIQSPDQSALHKARELQRAKLVEYKDRFFDGSDDSSSLFENASCPTCAREADNIIFEKQRGKYSYCPVCDHIFLSNPLTDEATISFYTNYPSNTLEWHKAETDFYDLIYAKGLEMIQQFNPGSSLLDIGCSSGLFLSNASKQGFSCIGLEPNNLEKSYALSQGINVCGSELTDLDQVQKFDVITLWDVLEHIKNPRLYLPQLHNHLLSKESLVFIQVPSADSLSARILRDKCKMFDGIEHLTLFSLKSLKSTFEQAGFTMLSAISVIPDLYPITNYLSYCSDPYLQQPSHKYPIENLGFSDIEQNMLGYKIQAVFKPA